MVSFASSGSFLRHAKYDLFFTVFIIFSMVYFNSKVSKLLVDASIKVE